MGASNHAAKISKHRMATPKRLEGTIKIWRMPRVDDKVVAVERLCDEGTMKGYEDRLVGKVSNANTFQEAVEEVRAAAEEVLAHRWRSVGEESPGDAKEQILRLRNEAKS